MLVWSQHVRDVAAKIGMDTKASDKFREQWIEQGFVNVRKESVEWAVGAWPMADTKKLVGRSTLENTR